MKMNVAFWDNQLCERGTTVALYDYAYYNQTILKNTSYIFYDKNRAENNTEIIRKFKAEFMVQETDGFKYVDAYLLQNNITHIYIIKGGSRDGNLSQVAKNCIHCVFHAYEPHGEIYATIAPWIKGNEDRRYPVVPHMINLPPLDSSQNKRQALGIPIAAVVFGGYGGKDSFNIPFVQEVVYQVAKHNPQIYFLFANFNRFSPEALPNIIHLETITDLAEKVRFINTCDAMLWAQNMGETFGIAMGEFSSQNKPILAKNIGLSNPNLSNIGHVHLLGEKALWYTNPNNLTELLLNFNPAVERLKDWNVCKEYTPEKVMQQFKAVYLT